MLDASPIASTVPFLTNLAAVNANEPGVVLITAFCATILAEREPAVLGAARDLLAMFDALESIDTDALDALVVCELQRRLPHAGLSSAAVARLAAAAASSVKAAPPEVRAQGRVRYLTRALADAGLLGRSLLTPHPAGVDALLAHPEGLFEANNDQLIDLCDHLDAGAVDIEQVAADVLALVALGELRNYSIDAGCRLVRTLARVGNRSAAYADGVDFLRMQRRADGSYGFLNPFLDLSAAGITEPQTQFFLPLTMNVVWALADVQSAESEAVLV
ncbi:MAG: hypothetical protein NVS4B13_02930 [Candidatus Elarobacter sp.]